MGATNQLSHVWDMLPTDIRNQSQCWRRPQPRGRNVDIGCVVVIYTHVYWVVRMKRLTVQWHCWQPEYICWFPYRASCKHHHPAGLLRMDESTDQQTLYRNMHTTTSRQLTVHILQYLIQSLPFKEYMPEELHQYITNIRLKPIKWVIFAGDLWSSQNQLTWTLLVAAQWQTVSFLSKHSTREAPSWPLPLPTPAQDVSVQAKQMFSML